MLVLPRSGDTTVERLLRKVRLLALRSLLLAPRAELPGELRSDLAALQQAGTDLLRRDPERLLEATEGMDVLPGLLLLAGRAAPSAEVLREVVPHLLAALAPALPGSLSWRSPVRRIVLGQEIVEFAQPARRLVAGPGGVSVELPDGRHRALEELPARPASSPLRVGRLGLVDTFALASHEAHPDKDGNALDLGGRPPAQWVAAYDSGLELVRAGLPELYAELSVSFRRLVPVGFEPERHLSASYREAPGLVYATLHPDPVVLAEVIVHETQHGKLNVLSWLDPVLHNGRSEWTRSPVRPDLRPLSGVLLAAHAFVPVAALHRGLAEADHELSRTPAFDQRRSRVLTTNGESMAILRDKAKPTEVGQAVLDELQWVHRELTRAYQR